MGVFLAGVGNAKILKGTTLVANANTLINSSLEISTSVEDIRGGKGAALIGRYFHTSELNLTIEDALFDLNYIALNVGGNVVVGGDVFYTEQLTASASGEATLSKTAIPFESGGTIYAYYRLASDPNASWTTATVATNKVAGLTASTVYCVQYLYTNDTAKKLVISSSIIPSIVTVYLTANLYQSGTADVNVSGAAKVGTLTIKIYQLQLSGAPTLNMSMDGAATCSLEGMALAVQAAGCDDDGTYGEIIDVRDAGSVFDDCIGIFIEDSANFEYVNAASVTELVNVWAQYSKYAPKKLSTSNFTLALTGTTGLSVTGAVLSGTATTGSGVLTAVGKEGSNTLNQYQATAAVIVSAS